jgi:murein DD-endopeptidase MepM/ murein hydrolase activator NlpD
MNKMKKRTILSIIIAVVIVMISVALFYPRDDDSPENVQEEETILPTVEYGIVVDSLTLERGVVRRNQFLSDILLNYDVDYGTIDRLARESKKVFDVRKIRAGQPYAVIRTNDSVPETLYFIYEESPTSYIVYHLIDSVHAYRGEKPVEVRLASASGVINTSLWETMVADGTDPNLANELSEVFAWTIDFFGIQKGDNYKVLYENLLVDDMVIGIGKIRSAMIKHMGEDYYAFYFEAGEKGDYYDDKGGSMRRTFLKAPLRFKRISSRFSYSRLHPVLKIRRPHTGVDYAASAGTPVYAVGDGVVTRKGWDSKGGGNFVKIRHNGTYTTVYMHLQGFANGLKTGTRVKQGDVIGYVGSTGMSTGPHLDFRFYRNGKPIDPLKVESPPAEPVDTAYLTPYYHLRDSMIRALDTVRIEIMPRP